jgi:apolipoprotein N-acyltransferase
MTFLCARGRAAGRLDLQGAALWSCSLLLAGFANPGMPLPWLAWIALVPLFAAVELARRRRQAWLFGSWGLAWWCWSAWWLVPAAIDYIGLAPWLAIVLGVAVAATLSLPYWLIGWCWSCLSFGSRAATLSLRALLFALLAGGFPSVMPGSLASGQYVHPHLIVDIGGVPLLLCAVVLVNLLIAESLEHLARPRRALATLLAGLAIPAALWGYGHERLAMLREVSSTAIEIGWVQPNLERDDSIDPLLETTRELAFENPRIELLAWPELPPSCWWCGDMADRERGDALQRAIGKPLLLSSGYVFAGSDDASLSDGGPRPYYNAAQLVSAGGELLGSYYKQRLVPFFEFLPFERDWPRLRQFFPNSLFYVPGRSAQPLQLPGQIAIAPLICYEMIFPSLAQRQVDAGAQVFINPVSDGWFGESRGSISHVALAWFRTVEHHRPWLRVANGGITVAVDAGGRRLMPLTALQQKASGRVRLEIPATDSFYSSHPHLFLTLAGLCVVAGMAVSARNSSVARRGAFSQ